MVFIDERHQNFYEKCITQTNSIKDPYRKSLFYLLGLTAETRNHVKEIYDFKENCIEPAALCKAWQTSTTTKVTRLAFNLYNGFYGVYGNEILDRPCCYTPEDLFCTELMPYMFEAVKLRYPEYYNEIHTSLDDG